MGFFDLLAPSRPSKSRTTKLSPAHLAARRLADVYNRGEKKTFSSPGSTFIDSDDAGRTVQLSVHTDGRVWATRDLEDFKAGNSFWWKGLKKPTGKFGEVMYGGRDPTMEEEMRKVGMEGLLGGGGVGMGMKSQGLGAGPGSKFGVPMGGELDMPWNPDVFGGNGGMGLAGLAAQGVSAHDHFFQQPGAQAGLGGGLGGSFGGGFGGPAQSSHKQPPFVPQQQQQQQQQHEPSVPKFPTLPFQHPRSSQPPHFPFQHFSQPHAPQPPHNPTLPFQHPSSTHPTALDPLLTAHLPLGARGVRAYVPGQSTLDPLAFGSVSDPAANYQHLKKLDELRQQQQQQQQQQQAVGLDSPSSFATALDPLITAKLPLGARGVREYVPGQSKLDHKVFGEADDPAANYRYMKELDRLKKMQLGGIKEKEEKEGEGGKEKK